MKIKFVHLNEMARPMPPRSKFIAANAWIDEYLVIHGFNFQEMKNIQRWLHSNQQIEKNGKQFSFAQMAEILLKQIELGKLPTYNIKPAKNDPGGFNLRIGNQIFENSHVSIDFPNWFNLIMWRAKHAFFLATLDEGDGQVYLIKKDQFFQIYKIMHDLIDEFIDHIGRRVDAEHLARKSNAK